MLSLSRRDKNNSSTAGKREDVCMLRMVWFAALALWSAAAQAQQYPSGSVRVLVGFAAGSGPDIQARTIGQQLQFNLGQSFVIENRPGANGTIAARMVATAAPDGQTLLFSSSSITPTPHIYKSLGYDTLTDLRVSPPRASSTAC
jgi:tripartite-type tricarboxylate transporter receptor subunit TctC